MQSYIIEIIVDDISANKKTELGDININIELRSGKF